MRTLTTRHWITNALTISLLTLAAGIARADFKSDYSDGIKAADKANWANTRAKMQSAIAAEPNPQTRIPLYGKTRNAAEHDETAHCAERVKPAEQCSKQHPASSHQHRARSQNSSRCRCQSRARSTGARGKTGSRKARRPASECTNATSARGSKITATRTANANCRQLFRGQFKRSCAQQFNRIKWQSAGAWIIAPRRRQARHLSATGR